MLLFLEKCLWTLKHKVDYENNWKTIYSKAKDVAYHYFLLHEFKIPQPKHGSSGLGIF